MKYCFTTLSIGEEYENKTIEFYSDLALRTKNCDFFIAIKLSFWEIEFLFLLQL